MQSSKGRDAGRGSRIGSGLGRGRGDLVEPLVTSSGHKWSDTGSSGM